MGPGSTSSQGWRCRRRRKLLAGFNARGEPGPTSSPTPTRTSSRNSTGPVERARTLSSLLLCPPMPATSGGGDLRAEAYLALGRPLRRSELRMIRRGWRLEDGMMVPPRAGPRSAPTSAPEGEVQRSPARHLRISAGHLALIWLALGLVSLFVASDGWAAHGSAKPTTIGYHYRSGAVCRDGWQSSATRSGACSDHGGVARWLSNGSYVEPAVPMTGLERWEYRYEWWIRGLLEWGAWLCVSGRWWSGHEGTRTTLDPAGVSASHPCR